eukprot:CAMPEP_0195596864 /NCGR_PEP_ID=MMETSP0815-20121206/2684_1 /TAXON_ID=97485 /ORGANISM="Prymnesium parvum, Strain Texoma1" /LENGTH=255 /DNA_ID=CAMNT_0040736177 /DNA_START=1 /DNA_END=768 /DNA_ORIENTATION=-
MRMKERFSSKLMDLRRRHLLHLCFLALRTKNQICQLPSVPTIECEMHLDALELEEQVEEQARMSEIKLRKHRLACATFSSHIRQKGMSRLCFFALRANAVHGNALRSSYAASIIARRLVGRDVLGVVLRVWRQHVVQLTEIREIHAQLSSVVNERLQAAEAHYAVMLDEQAQLSRQQLAALRCRFADTALTASHRAILASCWRILRLNTANGKMIRERRTWRKVLSEYEDEKRKSNPVKSATIFPDYSLRTARKL